MAQVRFTNNAKTLLDTAINSSITTVVVTDGTVLPALSGGDWFYLTLEDNLLNREIVKVTARSVNTLTVVRGQDGTAAASWAAGVKAENRLTNAAISEIAAAVSGITPTSAFLALVDDTTNGALLTTLGISAYAQTLLDDANAGAFMTTLGIASGVQTWLATPSSANLLAAMSDKTGTGLLVFGTSPTLTTPALGTPSALVLTNATGLPLASVTGLGSGIATWLATPSSANLLAALTTKTGTGLSVFDTSPSLTTPTIADATISGTWAGSAAWSGVQSFRGGGSTIPAVGASTGAAIFASYSSTFGLLMGARSSDGAGWIQAQKINGDTDAYPLLLNPNGGQVRVGSGSPQSTSLLAVRVGNNGIEFGHPNTAGYGSTIGAESGSGKPFLAFNGEHGTSASTYMTRGIKASIFRGDNAGGFVWSTVASANANNQSPVDLMTLSNGGGLALAGDPVMTRGANETVTGAKTLTSVVTISVANQGLLLSHSNNPYWQVTNTTGSVQLFGQSLSTGARFGTITNHNLDVLINSSSVAQWTSTTLSVYGNMIVGSGNALGTSTNHSIKINGGDNGAAGVDFQAHGGNRWGIGRNYSGATNGNDLHIYSYATGFSVTISYSTNAATFAGNITAPDFLTSSDERLKKDFKPFKDALAKVRGLRAGEYTRISTGKREVGFMAQDFERVGEPLFVDNATSHKALRYPRTPALLAAAIQELEAKLDRFIASQSQ